MSYIFAERKSEIESEIDEAENQLRQANFELTFIKEEFMIIRLAEEFAHISSRRCPFNEGLAHNCLGIKHQQKYCFFFQKAAEYLHSEGKLDLFVYLALVYAANSKKQ